MEARHQARARMRKLPEAQRNAWLDIAESEFRAFGFEAASLNRILARAGLSKGQAYYYFADKAELYRAVMERAFEQFSALLDMEPVEPTSAEEYWQRLATLFANVTRILKHDHRLAELGRSIYLDEKSQAAIADILADMQGRFERFLEQGRQLGAIRTDLPLPLLANMAFAAAREADRWFALQTRSLDETEALALNQRVFAAFAAMLGPDKPHAHDGPI